MIEDYGIEGIFCNHNNLQTFFIIVEDRGRDVFYHKEMMYPEARTNGETSINSGVLLFPILLDLYIIFVYDFIARSYLDLIVNFFVYIT